MGQALEVIVKGNEIHIVLGHYVTKIGLEIGHARVLIDALQEAIKHIEGTPPVFERRIAIAFSPWSLPNKSTQTQNQE